MTAVAQQKGIDRTAIRPFRVSVSDADLSDMRKRIAATKWPDRETENNTSQGVQLATVQKLARYWANDYDWRKCEARINSFPNFLTEIDGLDIHFIHVRSKHENAMPLIITHGWPGSIIEHLKVIEALANPENPADAFHVVVPSMPGYGFSGKPTAPGWDPDHIASAWVQLMKRLGYNKFVAQGGDWGAIIVERMGLMQPPELIGIHTNMACAIPPDVNKLAFAGAPAPENLTPDERAAYDRVAFFYTQDLAYAIMMAQRPQTLTALADSPIGLAAWIFDHDQQSHELIARVFDGKQEGLSRDDICDNLTLYWLMNTAISSARLYHENKYGFFDAKQVPVPTAVSVFPQEIYAAPKSWCERAYPKLVYYNKAAKGCHFAAWEQPKLFVDEVRNGFRPMR